MLHHQNESCLCCPPPHLSYEGRREQKGKCHFDKTPALIELSVFAILAYLLIFETLISAIFFIRFDFIEARDPEFTELLF